MADADTVRERERKRDRVRRYARRVVPVPLAVRTGDLPKRAASAVVMLAMAGGALWASPISWQIFVLVVGLVCFGEFVRLIWRATQRLYVRLPALVLGAVYMAQAGILLSEARGMWAADGARLADILGIMSVIAIVGVVIFTDTGAYFFGRAIGGPKIAPRISPSKTWAGLAGGALVAVVWSLVTVLLFDNLLPSQGYWTAPRLVMVALSAAFLAVVAQAGDFFESWLKRKARMKDSSGLIPGHGGVFDRVDGLIPVAFVSLFLPFPFGSTT